MSTDPTQTAIDDLLSLLVIPGPSTEEAQVAEHIERTLLSLGVPREHIVRDRAHEQSRYGGQCGNLIVRFPAVGDHPGPTRVFCTHMDTVALARGCKPRVAPPDEASPAGKIVNDAPGTALGGDDRTGCAVLLQVARALTGPLADQPRPAVVLLFTVQEELGLLGARHLDVSLLGLRGPAMCFNFDGGRVEKLVTKLIGAARVEIEVRGVAAHAGAAPAEGVSAAVIAGKAIAGLAREGWHGAVNRDGGQGTSNIGTIHGGEASNVVMDHLKILAEMRSHDPAFRARIRRAFEEAFGRAAAETTNIHGRCGEVSFSGWQAYEAFALPDDAPVVQAALRAIERCGLSAQPTSNDGGMDANWLHAHGLPTASLGCGMRQVHTVDEWIDLKDFIDGCRVAVELAGAR